MRDHEQRAAAGVAVGLDALRDDGERVDVEPGVGLVEDGELGLEEQELEHLDLLLLAAREAHVELAHEEALVEVELVGDLTDALAELAGRGLELGAHLADGAQERVERHAGDLDGRLVGEEDARERALVGGEGRDVLAVEGDGARGDLVGGVAHDHVAERGLARAVGPHEDVRLASADLEVDAVQDGGVLGSGTDAAHAEKLV